MKKETKLRVQTHIMAAVMVLAIGFPLAWLTSLSNGEGLAVAAVMVSVLPEAARRWLPGRGTRGAS